MLKITLGAAVDNEIWNVELSYQTFADGKWQILINNYYNGTMWKQNGEWCYGINNNSQLTTTDLYLLGEIIDEHIRQVSISGGYILPAKTQTKY